MEASRSGGVVASAGAVRVSFHGVITSARGTMRKGRAFRPGAAGGAALAVAAPNESAAGPFTGFDSRPIHFTEP